MTIHSASDHGYAAPSWCRLCGSSDLSCGCEAIETPAPEPQFWTVAVYLTDRAYGGPEEGGWWYECGQRVDDLRELEDLGDQRRPRTFLSEEEASAHCRKLNETIEATVNKGRREISSVLSNGRYSAQVHDGYPPAHYPETRPHYE